MPACNKLIYSGDKLIGEISVKSQDVLITTNERGTQPENNGTVKNNIKEIVNFYTSAEHQIYNITQEECS